MKETERRIQDTIIANIESAQVKPGSASWWKTTNYMLGKGKRCSTALDFDAEEMNQYFADIAGTRILSLRERQKLEGRHHWRSRRISCMEYYAKREAVHLRKIEYPPGFFLQNAHNLTFPLKHIIDTCLAHGSFLLA